MSETNTCVLLASRPGDRLLASNFEVCERPLAPLQAGQFRIHNRYFSLDAGFRQWMNEGSGDNYLPAMALGEPVQSIVLGEVVESRHEQYPLGSVVMGRTAWEQYSVADGSDLMSILEPDPDVPLHEYLCALGPAGLTAYFGLFDIGQPQRGERFVINAAAGGVGSYAGQMARAEGCFTVGIAGGEHKCRWLRDSLGYDRSIDHRGSQPLAEQLLEVLPEGADIVFDNVGGAMLGTLLGNLAERARVVLCGAISQYDSVSGHAGVENLWQLITKRARAEGFMFSDSVERYPEALDYIAGLLKSGRLVSPVHISEGIEQSGKAFVDMLDGNSQGKCLVRLLD